MKRLILAILALPLAGCVTPQQEQALENGCSSVAAGRTGFYGGQNNSLGAYKAYAYNYYACRDASRYAAATYYGYGGYGYGYGYGYPYASGYPYAYPYYGGYYGPAVGIGVGVGVPRR